MSERDLRSLLGDTWPLDYILLRTLSLVMPHDLSRRGVLAQQARSHPDPADLTIDLINVMATLAVPVSAIMTIQIV
jgi:hypothetical protein